MSDCAGGLQFRNQDCDAGPATAYEVADSLVSNLNNIAVQPIGN